MKIGLYCSESRKPQLQAISQIIEESGLSALTGENVCDLADVIIAIGGDGSILWAARDAAVRGIPILGINMGSLGFLAEVEMCIASDAIKALANGNYRLERRMMIDVSSSPIPLDQVSFGSAQNNQAQDNHAQINQARIDQAPIDQAPIEEQLSFNQILLVQASLSTASLSTASLSTASSNPASLNTASLNTASLNTASLNTASANHNARSVVSQSALNDVCVLKTEQSLPIKLELCINDVFVDTYQADGIIISTPTGSTAYNLSAGGPLLKPDARMIVITPIAPHSMTQRSIVISADDIVTISPIDSSALLVADGRKICLIEPGDLVTVKRSKLETTLVRVSDMSFYDRLKKKFSG